MAYKVSSLLPLHVLGVFLKLILFTLSVSLARPQLASPTEIPTGKKNCQNYILKFVQPPTGT